LLSIVDRVRRIVANGCERPDAGMVGRELANGSAARASPTIRKA